MNALIRTAFFLGLLAASMVQAQPAGSVAPDVGAGKKRAAACFACHNANGIANIPGTPHLAGQERGYLEAALRAYRDGSRQNATMNAMAKPLSDADIGNIAAYFSLQLRMDNGQTVADAVAMMQRLQPEGRVQVQATAAPQTVNKAPASGESVYQSSCAACHASGAAGAPKLGDRGAWAARIAQGEAALVSHAIKGINAMPPKGGCASCAEEDIQRAVSFMVKQSQ